MDTVAAEAEVMDMEIMVDKVVETTIARTIVVEEMVAVVATGDTSSVSLLHSV